MAFLNEEVLVENVKKCPVLYDKSDTYLGRIYDYSNIWVGVLCGNS